MNRSDYRRHFAALKKLATEAGADIDIDYFPRRLPEKQGINGSYKPQTKHIYMKVYGNQARKLVLACLAHEVRHAQHHHQGMYPDYYDLRYDEPDYLDKVIAGTAKEPDVITGWEAECDCNYFAVKWMLGRGIPLDQTKKSHKIYFMDYPIMSVYTYRIRGEIMARRNRLRQPLAVIVKTKSELTL